MIELTIPGRGELRIEHLVTDVNGTLALDGILLDGLAKRIGALRDRIQIHLLTADTHGRQAVINQQLNLTAVKITDGNEAQQKADYVRNLGADSVIAIGQGANDAAMLKAAALGICVMSQEGVAVETLLDKPLRLIASLRQ
jgi:P-type E1-E2 ATPase